MLTTIDVIYGEATIVGYLEDNFCAIAFDADGALFAVTCDDADDPESIFELDPEDGTPTLLCELGTGDTGESIVFDSEGDLFHASGSGASFETVVFERLTDLDSDECESDDIDLKDSDLLDDGVRALGLGIIPFFDGEFVDH